MNNSVAITGIFVLLSIIARINRNTTATMPMIIYWPVKPIITNEAPTPLFDGYVAITLFDEHFTDKYFRSIKSDATSKKTGCILRGFRI